MKKLLVISLALFMMLGLVGMASASYVWFDASSIKGGGDLKPDTSWKLLPCEVVWLELYASEIPTPGLISMGLIANYDPSQFEVTPGTDFDHNNWWFGTLSTPPGAVDMTGGRLMTGLAGDNIHLGTIELHCIAPGTSLISLIGHPPPYDDFVLLDGTVLDDSILLGKIEIENIVPIPGTLLLLGSGLAGIFGLGRRKFNKK